MRGRVPAVPASGRSCWACCCAGGPSSGRQFWRLAGPYFKPRRGDREQLAAAADRRCSCWLSRSSASGSTSCCLEQQQRLFTALQELDQPAFWRAIIFFCVVAADLGRARPWSPISSASCRSSAGGSGRTPRCSTDWLSGDRLPPRPVRRRPDRQPRAAHPGRRGLVHRHVAEPGVRADLVDARRWSRSRSSCGGCPGPLTSFGVTVPRALVFIAYIFVIVATVIAIRIGRPLIRLNFLAERLNASYRYSLIRVRDNSEAIALYGGEGVEERGLMTRFSAVIANVWALVFRNLKFNGLQPRHQPDRGDPPDRRPGAAVLRPADDARRQFTQSADAFGQVAGSLSFFRGAYDTFAAYRATLDRLTGLLDANDEARALPGAAAVVARGRARGRGPGRVHAERRAADQPPRPDRRAGGVAAGPRPLGQRQDDPAAQPGRAVAVRARGRLATRRAR